jgi:hypothetical protein
LNTGLALDANKMMNVFNGSAQFSADANGKPIEAVEMKQDMSGYRHVELVAGE